MHDFFFFSVADYTLLWMLIFKCAKSGSFCVGGVREDISNVRFAAFHIKATHSTWDQIRQN